MSEMTKVKLDPVGYDDVLPWRAGFAFMNANGLFPAGKGTWEKRSKMPGFPIIRPNGPKGSRYMIPRQVFEFLLTCRCTDNEPGQTIAP